MPATIGEAFVSPLKERGGENDSTEDIRNPGYGWQKLFYPPQPQPEPHSFQVFNGPQGSLGHHNGHHQFYSGHQGSHGVYQRQLNPTEHQCDKLILELIMCPLCRAKLGRIGLGLGPSYGTGQTGGGSQWSLWLRDNTFIANIALGLLFLFCLDRILKYRLL